MQQKQILPLRISKMFVSQNMKVFIHERLKNVIFSVKKEGKKEKGKTLAMGN